MRAVRKNCWGEFFCNIDGGTEKRVENSKPIGEGQGRKQQRKSMSGGQADNDSSSASDDAAGNV